MCVSDSASEGVSGSRIVRIAARHSDLARLQAYRVGDALRKVFPELKIEYAFRASLGDINQRDPLWKMPEKGVFTEDFLADLIEGRADLVVHSWKDLPTEPRPHTEIVATLPRADVRDLLLFRKDRLETAKNSGRVRILTSSPRRAHNLKAFLEQHLPFTGAIRAEVSFENVRGNIPTRLTKLLNQDVDALVVAKAALDRLLEAPEPEFAEVQAVIRGALAKTRLMCLPLAVNPTAAAQGALAVEINKNNLVLRECLKRINCEATFRSVNAERRTLASYGGGCHQKIGVNVLSRSFGEITFLRGLTDAGEVLDRVALKSATDAMSPVPAQQIFPREGEASTFFERVPLGRDAWVQAESERYLWIARDNAWPSGFQAREDAVVWTAGLKTWRKLAERGIWVTGTSEGLGENEPTRLETLLGESRLNWLKLTHQETAAVGVDSEARICATYRLRELAADQVPDLSQRRHFYWMSTSAFDQALKMFPGILSASHASGPGHTHQLLKERLGGGRTPAVFLNVEEWRRAVLGST